MKKAVIFDLDGTLADTIASITYCGNLALSRFGLPSFGEEDYKHFVGDGAAMLIRRALLAAGDERLEHFTSLGVVTSHMCRDPLLMYGAKALEDHKKGLCTYEVEQAVLAIVVTTGIASIFLTKDFTPDYNSGLAHAVFYALTSYPVIEEKHLHGEVVGFGVLLLLLVDGQMDEFEKIYQLNKDLKLPVSLEDIEITEEQWKERPGFRICPISGIIPTR